MNKLIFVVLMLCLSGCQSIQPRESSDTALACRLSETQLNNLLKLEWNYLQASLEDQRAIRSLLREQQDIIGLALLLSQPGNSLTDIQSAVSNFEKIQLDTASLCDGDRYLALREQHAVSLLALQKNLTRNTAETQQLQRESTILRQQIDALTDIERDISIQKDGEEK